MVTFNNKHNIYTMRTLIIFIYCISLALSCRLQNKNKPNNALTNKTESKDFVMVNEMLFYYNNQPLPLYDSVGARIKAAIVQAYQAFCKTKLTYLK
jgi:hypothetical protein